ncbi:MAG: rhamnulokinase family protein [Planctomycetia bacterium]|nr:rhamnulokinase family protein [Planctomycetia bacterium]
MNAGKSYLAVDLGASSGRVVLGKFDGERISLEDMLRFENGASDLGGVMCWDLQRLWNQVVAGIGVAGLLQNDIRSIGVDAWGVDFGMLDHNGQLLANPVAYRDARTNGMMDAAFEIVPKDAIFAQTGLQFMQFNTLYQLLAMRRRNDPLLEVGRRFLQIPDLFHWLLSGEMANEFTNATTTQFFNPLTGTWAYELLAALDIPSHFLGEIAQPGTCLGKLRPYVAQATGLDLNVVLPGTHDTASAVLAAPGEGAGGWGYISLGTWALMGIESPHPVVNQRMQELNFTNEGGVGGTYRLLKNITGMWILQECKRIWGLEGKKWSWTELTQKAQDAPGLVRFINPEAPEFFAPENMVESICEFCRKTGQSVPATEGEVLRCAQDSIAMRFRDVFFMCQEINAQPIQTIHIVGGGVQNEPLCQAAANAMGCRVAAGPVEATALGNILMQAIADGAAASIEEARQIVRRSFPLKWYTPQDTAAWSDAYERYRAFC